MAILSLDAIQGYPIRATDGEIGRVVDALFDDRDWIVRDLVVDTGGWLGGREVLVSPVALGPIDAREGTIAAALTRTQVAGSPRVDARKPVSRQAQAVFLRPYGSPPAGAPSPALAPRLRPPGGPELTPAEAEVLAREQEEQDPHLRSAREVIDYALAATDGEVGHVEDHLIDDRSWTIRWLVVDTTNWWPGGHVLFSPMWVRSVSWDESRVAVDLDRERIRGAPAFDPRRPVDRALEARLVRHYGREGYWEAEGHVA